MTIQSSVLQNIQKFLERVSPQGVEAYPWCEAHSSVVQEIQAIQAAATKEQIDAAVKAALTPKDPTP